MDRLAGKVALITGTATGIGKATALLFAAEGAKIAMCDIVEDKLLKTADEITANGGKVLARTCDLSKYDEIQAFVDATIAEYGTMDILVNNAANFGNGGIMDTTEEVWDTSFAINVKAPFRLMQLCFPYLQANCGKVINVVSRGAITGVAGLASYDSSKGALASLTLEAAREWAEYHINVNAVAPECLSENTMEIIQAVDPDEVWYKTMMSLGSWFTEPPLGWDHFFPKYVAPSLLFLASDDAVWVTGQILKPGGGLDIHW